MNILFIISIVSPPFSDSSKQSTLIISANRRWLIIYGVYDCMYIIHMYVYLFMSVFACINKKISQIFPLGFCSAYFSAFALPSCSLCILPWLFTIISCCFMDCTLCFAFMFKNFRLYNNLYLFTFCNRKIESVEHSREWHFLTHVNCKLARFESQAPSTNSQGPLAHRYFCI